MVAITLYVIWARPPCSGSNDQVRFFPFSLQDLLRCVAGFPFCYSFCSACFQPGSFFSFYAPSPVQDGVFLFLPFISALCGSPHGQQFAKGNGVLSFLLFYASFSTLSSPPHFPGIGLRLFRIKGKLPR